MSSWHATGGGPRGIVAILFGVMAFAWPGLTLGALVLLFGAYAFVDVPFAVAAAVSGAPGHALVGDAAGRTDRDRGGDRDRRLAGPHCPRAALMIAGWAVATGVLQIVAAIRLRREIEGEWALILSGVLSVLLGVGLAILPWCRGTALSVHRRLRDRLRRLVDHASGSGCET